MFEWDWQEWNQIFYFKIMEPARERLGVRIFGIDLRLDLCFDSSMQPFGRLAWPDPLSYADWDRLSFSDDLLGDVVIPVKDVAEAKFQVIFYREAFADFGIAVASALFLLQFLDSLIPRALLCTVSAQRVQADPRAARHHLPRYQSLFHFSCRVKSCSSRRS